MRTVWTGSAIIAERWTHRRTRCIVFVARPARFAIVAVEIRAWAHHVTRTIRRRAALQFIAHRTGPTIRPEAMELRRTPFTFPTAPNSAVRLLLVATRSEAVVVAHWAMRLLHRVTPSAGKPIARLRLRSTVPAMKPRRLNFVSRTGLHALAALHLHRRRTLTRTFISGAGVVRRRPFAARAASFVLKVRALKVAWTALATRRARVLFSRRLWSIGFRPPTGVFPRRLILRRRLGSFFLSEKRPRGKRQRGCGDEDGFGIHRMGFGFMGQTPRVAGFVWEEFVKARRHR